MGPLLDTTTHPAIEQTIRRILFDFQKGTKRATIQRILFAFLKGVLFAFLKGLLFAFLKGVLFSFLKGAKILGGNP